METATTIVSLVIDVGLVVIVEVMEVVSRTSNFNGRRGDPVQQ